MYTTSAMSALTYIRGISGLAALRKTRQGRGYRIITTTNRFRGIIQMNTINIRRIRRGTTIEGFTSGPGLSNIYNGTLNERVRARHMNAVFRNNKRLFFWLKNETFQEGKSLYGPIQVIFFDNGLARPKDTTNPKVVTSVSTRHLRKINVSKEGRLL